MSANDLRPMRFFIDGEEVSEQMAIDAEQYAAARVLRGASGIVPERLRQPGETYEQYRTAWLEMETYEATPPTKWDHAPKGNDQ